MQKLWLLIGIVVFVLRTAPLAMSQESQNMPLSDVTARTHIHGLGVEGNSEANLLVATHHGLFRVDVKGSARLISPVQDFMGISPHPRDTAVLFASGHPPKGGNLGFIRSDDGGVTWKQISKGAGEYTADFHQMTVALEEPNTVFGSYHGQLQASRNGGKNWDVVGPSPDGLIALASRSSSELYAATEFGLLKSANGGKSWNTVIKDAPIGAVLATNQGALWVFDLNRGLLRLKAGSKDFEVVNDSWEGRVLLHLAVDPNNSQRMFASSGKLIWRSVDGGRTWSGL